ncbi:MAG: carboxypeptidase regulatory-like domain-containing protein, partial [Planctomycetes bacterium]|nr:carboxypeptidase regulatory-like domain-containing protein [Planctomycetota bacterium]
PPTCTLQASIAGLPGRKRLPGVLVRAVDQDGRGDRTVWVDLQNGELSWPLCPTGHVRLEIWAEGQAPAVLERVLAANEVHTLGEVLLEAGSQLRGRVVDPQGKAVADAAVFVGEESDLDLFEPRVRSDVDGSFVVSGVTSRSARVVVRARGFAVRSFDLDLPQDVLSPTPFEAQLSLGSTIEVIVGRPGSRETGIVQLSRRGRVVASVEVDEVGRALFANRGEGDYEVRLLGSDADVQAVHVGNAGGVVRVRIQ